MPENKITKWHNCHDDGWLGIIVPEAFSHPAKMSYGLLKRILAHAKEQGWLCEGDVILDCFGGVATTGILGAYEGYRVVCVELEQKFVDLAIQNFRLHDNAWTKLELPLPEIIQGDSRQLCQIVEKADVIVSSPPFHGAHQGTVDSTSLNKGACKRPWLDKATANNGYGHTLGQLGNMKEGKIDAIISSPPFQEAQTGGGIAQKGYHNESRRKGVFDLVGKRSYMPENQGQTSGNLGNLKSGDVDCVISSPPWEKQEGSMQSKKFKEGSAKMLSDRQAEGLTGGHYATPAARKRAMDKANKQTYGDSEGQLGQEQGDTFWAAAKTILEQCFRILKPGGHAIWVVKSFVRKGKIVDFPGDWQRLCESVGFKTVCVHHAMLVKETSHKTLFGHTETKRIERKSFFRRLTESKGSPRIDYEVVLCSGKSS